MRPKIAPWLFVPWLAVMVACEGPPGTTGPAGTPGTPGTPGTNGTNGTNGTSGTPGTPGIACWDSNGNGMQDPAEDRDGNSVWDARDCMGTGGTPAVACWDLDGDAMQDPAEDVNGDSAWDVLDCAGTSTGTLSGLVVDDATGALIEGATVTLEPLPTGLAAVTTGPDGTFRFARAPFGVYTIRASAPSLQVVASAVVAGRPVSRTANGVSLLAGEAAVVRFALPRIDRAAINVTALHTGSNAAYTNANCEACHSNREAETSRDPMHRPWHALAAHAAEDCTSCHATTLGVDVAGESGWENESAATLRKQVALSSCTTCHRCYPESFCAAGTCPTPCP